MNYTHHELERISYIQGNGQAPLYAELELAEAKKEAADDACIYIKEAKTGFPNEDFLQELINECRAMGQGRVTKAEVLEFCERLEELQGEIASSAEYGLDELVKAERLLA